MFRDGLGDLSVTVIGCIVFLTVLAVGADAVWYFLVNIAKVVK